MRLLHIAGLSSGVGKTAVLARLAAGLPGLAAIKLSPGGGEPELVTDPDRLARPGSDTARLIEAGAHPLLWLHGERERLHELWPAALDAVAGAALVGIEGNVLARFARPHARLIVGRVGLEEVKPSAVELVADADWRVVNRSADDSDAEVDDWRRRIGAPWSEPGAIVIDAASEGGAARLVETLATWTRR